MPVRRHVNMFDVKPAVRTVLEYHQGRSSIHGVRTTPLPERNNDGLQIHFSGGQISA